MKTIAIRGIKGYIGSLVATFLKENDYNVVELEREDVYSIEKLSDKLRNCSYVLNFSGYNAFSVWNKRNKRKIYESRILHTRHLVKNLNKINTSIHLINASAIGIYANKGINSEYDNTSANNFLSNVVGDWENEVKRFQGKYTICRFGIVLGSNSKVLKKMILPYRLGVKPYFSGDNFIISGIAEDELTSIMKFIIDKDLTSTINVCQPQCINFNDLSVILSEYFPCKFSVKFNLKKIKKLLGMRGKVLLESPAVKPVRLREHGYNFKYNTLVEVINSVYKS